jgi:hypothetical protein
MLEEIAKTYYDFDDAVIHGFKYTTAHEANSLEIQISCMNSKTDTWETFRVICFNVLYFRFFESYKICSTVVNTALLKTEDDIMTIDFFPTILGGRSFKENPESDFLVKFKNISVQAVEPSKRDIPNLQNLMIKLVKKVFTTTKDD